MTAPTAGLHFDEAMLDNAMLKDLTTKNVWSAPSVQGSFLF